MPQVIEKLAYTYDELSDEAKAIARDQFRAHALDYEWWEFVYDDADEIAKILGIDIDRKGKNTPAIWFSGFWSQGDGACFEGSYRYARHSKKVIREHAPKDTELHSIADRLYALQRRNFFQLTATVSHRGHYYHEFCTSIDVYRDGYHADADAAEDLADILRDFMRWIYRRLEAEAEWLMSDECIEQGIDAAASQFNEDGTLFL